MVEFVSVYFVTVILYVYVGLDREDVPQSHDPELIILGRVEETAVRRRGLIHHAHVMRMKLIHFVNNLHNYIMTRVS